MLPLLVLIVDTGEGGGRGCRGRSASIISDSSKLQIKAVLGQVAEHFCFFSLFFCGIKDIRRILFVMII